MFIDNQDLVNEIALSNESPTKNLTEYLMTIAKGIAKSKHFRNASHLREDLSSEILASLLVNYKNFNPEKSTNAFGYLSTIGINTGRAFIKKEMSLDDFRKTMTILARGE